MDTDDHKDHPIEEATTTGAATPDVGKDLEGSPETETVPDDGRGPGPGKETDDAEKAKPDPESIVNTTPPD
jgi:hypothetical protein